MYIIRPVESKDIDALEDFANKSSIGIVNLPRSRDFLLEIIEESLRSFSQDIKKPDLEKYTFVLEDFETKELGGTAGICSQMGVGNPAYYFKIESTPHEFCKEPLKILNSVSYTNGPSEICALYLKPEFRKEGLGKFLSLSRFLFIADQRCRFKDTIVAEMRGYVKENSIPFWNLIGRKFLDIPYEELSYMELKNRSFIPKVLPKWPLYIDLLPKEAQDCLAKTHDSTIPALKMLYKQGFSFTSEVHPFDGGPKISCKTEEIDTISSSVLAKVVAFDNYFENNDSYMLSNAKLDFRACLTNMKIVGNNQISIPKKVAEALNVTIGDTVRYINTLNKDKR